MQMIVRHLLFENADNLNSSIFRFSLWIDAAFQRPVEDVIGDLEAQEHRRAIKSHVPLDGIPFYSQLKYVVVGRDARDVAMSLWNHYSNYTDFTYDRLDQAWEGADGPFLRCPEDVREFWRHWINRGAFEWESEGYPFWSNLWHTRSWRDHRDPREHTLRPLQRSVSGPVRRDQTSCRLS